jgi:hypothetical protein
MVLPATEQELCFFRMEHLHGSGWSSWFQLLPPECKIYTYEPVIYSFKSVYSRCVY